MAVLKSLVARPTLLRATRFSHVSCFALCTLASLAAGSSARAAILTVDDDGVKPNQYKTIQAAILAASNGDRIRVLPGVYYGPVVVNKSVELVGAGAGTVPSGEQNNPATDTVVRNGGQGGFDVLASGVTINGFTVQGTPSATTYPNAGILVRTGTDRILNNNVLEDNGLGVYVEGSQQRLDIRNSVFLDNVRTTNPDYIPSGGIFTAGGPVNDSTIAKNYFTGNAQFSINIGGGGSTGGLQITNNVAESESTFLVIGSTTGARVVSNSVSNLINSAILCYGQNDNMLISLNTLVGGPGNVAGNGIRFTLNYGATTGDTNPVVKNNAISQFALDGISLNAVSGATVNNNTVQQNRDGIRLQNAQNSTILNNDALSNRRDAIRVESPSAGNTLRRNALTGSGEFDAYDETGTPTTPANAWINNSGATQNRPGLVK